MGCVSSSPVKASSTHSSSAQPISPIANAKIKDTVVQEEDVRINFANQGKDLTQGDAVEQKQHQQRNEGQDRTLFLLNVYFFKEA